MSIEDKLIQSFFKKLAQQSSSQAADVEDALEAMKVKDQTSNLYNDIVKLYYPKEIKDCAVFIDFTVDKNLNFTFKVILEPKSKTNVEGKFAEFVRTKYGPTLKNALLAFNKATEDSKSPHYKKAKIVIAESITVKSWNKFKVASGDDD